MKQQNKLYFNGATSMVSQKVSYDILQPRITSIVVKREFAL